jgi:hypothetical protein
MLVLTVLFTLTLITKSQDYPSFEVEGDWTPETLKIPTRSPQVEGFQEVVYVESLRSVNDKQAPHSVTDPRFIPVTIESKEESIKQREPLIKNPSSFSRFFRTS